MLYNFFVCNLQILVRSQSVCSQQALPALPNKHSSLVQKFVNYGQKQFYNICSWAQCCKTFLDVIYECSQYASIGKLFQPSLMFLAKARSQPKSGAHERLFTRIGSGLTRTQQTRMEKLDRDKHQHIMNINKIWTKKFYIIGPNITKLLQPQITILYNLIIIYNYISVCSWKAFPAQFNVFE